MKNAVFVIVSAIFAAVAVSGCRSPRRSPRRAAGGFNEFVTNAVADAGQPERRQEAVPAQQPKQIPESARKPVTDPHAWVPPVDDAIAKYEDRTLQQNDVVEVSIHTSASAAPTSASDIVDIAGFVTLPMVGDIKLGGYTTSEAEKVVRQAYIDGGFYTELNVKVTSPTIMKELERSYSMTGCVHKKGRFPYREGLTLLRAVIEAGDLTSYANGDIRITRDGVTTEYNLNRIKKLKDEDPLIQPRDIIEAEESFW